MSSKVAESARQSCGFPRAQIRGGDAFSALRQRDRVSDNDIDFDDFYFLKYNLVYSAPYERRAIIQRSGIEHEQITYTSSNHRMK